MKKELSVKAKYWPQCIPIASVPDLSNSDFTKILNFFYISYKAIIKIDVLIKFFIFFLIS